MNRGIVTTIYGLRSRCSGHEPPSITLQIAGLKAVGNEVVSSGASAAEFEISRRGTGEAKRR